MALRYVNYILITVPLSITPLGTHKLHISLHLALLLMVRLVQDITNILRQLNVGYLAL